MNYIKVGKAVHQLRSVVAKAKRFDKLNLPVPDNIDVQITALLAWLRVYESK
jgi:hypothetical protein